MSSPGVWQAQLHPEAAHHALFKIGLNLCFGADDRRRCVKVQSLHLHVEMIARNGLLTGPK